jgi:hypothetical protein
VADFVSTIRSLENGRVTLNEMHPRVTQLFFQPSYLQEADWKADREDAIDEEVLFATYYPLWTSLPGHLMYRVVMYDRAGRLRPRMVNHFTLIALLNGWSGTWMNRLTNLLPAGIPATMEPRCLCPAHLGIMGSGLYFSWGRTGMLPDEKAAESSWRILVDPQLNSRGRKDIRPRRWTPIPLAKFHGFPATLDQAFLAELQNATAEEDMPASSLFDAYEAVPQMHANLVTLLDRVDHRLGQRTKARMHELPTAPALDWLTRGAMPMVIDKAMPSLGATPPSPPLNPKAPQMAQPPTTAETIVLVPNLATEKRQTGSVSVDDLKCFLYCDHLEEWLLHGIGQEQNEEGEQPTMPPDVNVPQEEEEEQANPQEQDGQEDGEL